MKSQFLRELSTHLRQWLCLEGRQSVRSGRMWVCGSAGALASLLNRPILEVLTYFPSKARNAYLKKTGDNTIVNYINGHFDYTYKTTFGKWYLYYILPLVYLSLNLMIFIIFKFFPCFSHQSKFTGNEIFHSAEQSMMEIQKRGLHIYERSEFERCKVYHGLTEKQKNLN